MGPDSRILVEVLEQHFSELHNASRRLIAETPDELLYFNDSNNFYKSVGVNVLRGAAAVEQTCGGINSNLWDDPFEWTLPEQMSTSRLITDYLEEVETTRKQCFARFLSDADLFKNVMLPSGQVAPLISLLIDTVVRASTYQGQAMAASVKR